MNNEKGSVSTNIVIEAILYEDMVIQIFEFQNLGADRSFIEVVFRNARP